MFSSYHDPLPRVVWRVAQGTRGRAGMAGIKRELMAREEKRQAAASLADLLDEGVDVFCWCNRCGHHATLPTRRLIAEFGPDYPVPELGVRLRCSGCGCKDVASRPAWPSLGQVTRHA